jgi:hypothetical protein
LTASFATHRAAVQAIVDCAVAGQDPEAWLAEHLNASIAGITRSARVDDLLAWLRADEDVNFVVYDAPRGVCAKPVELVHALLETLVRELVAEGG